MHTTPDPQYSQKIFNSGPQLMQWNEMPLNASQRCQTFKIVEWFDIFWFHEYGTFCNTIWTGFAGASNPGNPEWITCAVLRAVYKCWQVFFRAELRRYGMAFDFTRRRASFLRKVELPTVQKSFEPWNFCVQDTYAWRRFPLFLHFSSPWSLKRNSKTKSPSLTTSELTIPLKRLHATAPGS